jgi:hypothetical protein
VPFSLDGEGRVLASWMSRNQVYWTISTDGARSFGPRIPAPRVAGNPPGEGTANYPLVLANRAGEVLLVWKQGSGVNWASYDRNGRFTGRQGTAGEQAGGNKPAAFVGTDDRFHIVL